MGVHFDCIDRGLHQFHPGRCDHQAIAHPLIVHVLRPIWRNVIILAHNFAIFPIVLFVMDRPVTETIWLALPGFLLLLLNLTWLSTALGVVCARYRDIPQIIASLMQVVFYLTPIMWLPNLLPERAGMYMLTFNPFFHLIEIVRAPLLGQLPSTQNWLAACGLAVFGWTLTLALYGRYRRRIAYWL